MSEEVKKGALGLVQDSPAERFFNGLIAENPTLVLMIGMCPTLAVTSSAMNGLGMGLATTFVLALSNAVIAALRKIIPATVRIPSFIVVIASFVTIVQLLMQAYFPALNKALGTKLKIDGIFGDATYKALVKYQKLKGWKPSGVVRTKTAHSFNWLYKNK